VIVTYTAGRQHRDGDVTWETRTAEGPFYHGGRGRVRPGGRLTAGRRTNSWGDTRGRSTHVWFGDLQTAALTALACRREHGRGYLYEVRPAARHVEYAPDGFKTREPLIVIAVLDLDAALGAAM
jgi:hypothetical protein